MALKGADFHIALKIIAFLNEETLTPYRFDVLSYRDLKNKELRDYIDRVGRLVYEAEFRVSARKPRAEYKKDKNE